MQFKMSSSNCGLDVMWDDMACKTVITKKEPKWVIELTKDTAYLVLMSGLSMSVVSIWGEIGCEIKETYCIRKLMIYFESEFRHTMSLLNDVPRKFDDGPQTQSIERYHVSPAMMSFLKSILALLFWQNESRTPFNHFKLMTTSRRGSTFGVDYCDSNLQVTDGFHSQSAINGEAVMVFRCETEQTVGQTIVCQASTLMWLQTNYIWFRQHWTTLYCII